MRLDLALVQLGLAPSRTKAQDLIEAGDVEILSASGWKCIQSSSHQLSFSSQAEGIEKVRVNSKELLKFVSRGGLKLEGALKHLSLNVQDQVCLDCGQSTGGFTDCLLQWGARQVVGFDVGHGQLAEKLRQDSRVIYFEGTHFEDLQNHSQFKIFTPKNGFDLIVADLSFVSLEKILPCFSAWGSRLLALVKPQFELGPRNLNSRGIVTDSELFIGLENQIRQSAEALGWKTLDYFPSQVEGRDGNQEFFLWAKR